MGLEEGASTDGRDYCIPSRTVAGFRDAVMSLCAFVVHCRQQALDEQVTRIAIKHLMSERELEGLYGCLTLMHGTGNHAFTAADFRRMVRTMAHEIASALSQIEAKCAWARTSGSMRRVNRNAPVSLKHQKQ